MAYAEPAGGDDRMIDGRRCLQGLRRSYRADAGDRGALTAAPLVVVRPALTPSCCLTIRMAFGFRACVIGTKADSTNATCRRRIREPKAVRNSSLGGSRVSASRPGVPEATYATCYTI